MISQDENMLMLIDFLERADKRFLIIALASNGQLVPSLSFPLATKSKAVYFIKKMAEPIKKDTSRNVLCGDMSFLPLDQLSSMVESVCLQKCIGIHAQVV